MTSRIRTTKLAVALSIAGLAFFSFAMAQKAKVHDEPSEIRFLAENETAMDKMMADMTVKPSGDVDRDFVAMMAPHHQGAIDMAQALLRYGQNEQLKRLAQEIIVTQQQEIAVMRLAVGLPPTPPVPISDRLPVAPSPGTPLCSSHVLHMLQGK